jgi:uncharacterized protein YqeY
MPTLGERLDLDLKEAMRSQDVVKREAIRMLRAALRYEELGKGRALTDDETNAVLARQAKQRRESIEQFKAGKRDDLVQKEEAELTVILGYMPQQMSREEITAAARKVMQEVGARGPADKGRVMGKLAPMTRGKAEGSTVAAVVDELLKSLTAS